MSETVFRHVQLWQHGALAPGELLVRDGRIAALGPRVTTAAGAAVLDGHGAALLPGLIDAQVHFRDPGFPEKEDLGSGSAAAAAGGVTAYLDMPNTRPPTVDAATLAAKHARARETSIVHWGFFMGTDGRNLDAVNAADNVPGVKMFMGSSTGPLLVADPAVQERVFRESRHTVVVHAEDEALMRAHAACGPAADPAGHAARRDGEVERRAIDRAIEWAVKYGRRLHVLHVSSAAGCALLAQAPRPLVSAECTPQHLTLTVADGPRLGARMKINPAIKHPADREALWAALHAGHLDFIATDHAPHTLAEKARPFADAPAGMPGVETSLALMLTHARAGRCTLAQVLRWLSEAPAAVYGLAGKGRLAAGADADLALVDLDAETVVDDARQHTRCGWSAFHGATLAGRVRLTMCAGTVVFADGRPTGARGGAALRCSGAAT